MQSVQRGIRSIRFFDHFAQQQRCFISHYTVLGIPQTANLEEIKAAFRKVTDFGPPQWSDNLKIQAV